VTSAIDDKPLAARTDGPTARKAQATFSEIALRAALAIAGGYALCYTVCGALAGVLPLSPVESATTAGLLTPLLALSGATMAFAASTPARAAAGILGLSAIAFLVMRWVTIA